MPQMNAVLLMTNRGAFKKFKRCTGIHKITRYSESMIQTTLGPKKFVSEFKDHIDAEELISKQVFNCDETGLYWKKKNF